VTKRHNHETSTALATTMTEPVADAVSIVPATPEAKADKARAMFAAFRSDPRYAHLAAHAGSLLDELQYAVLRTIENPSIEVETPDAAQALLEAVQGAEFLSYTITIDHLMSDQHAGGEVVVPTLFSTARAHQALLNQIAYFSSRGECANLATDPAHVAAIALSLGRPAVYYYTPCERLTNIIVDKEVFDSVFTDSNKGRGSFMATLTWFMMDCQVAIATFVERGQDPTLVAFSPDGLQFYEPEGPYLSGDPDEVQPDEVPPDLADLA
jgi:hypothetical protein